MLDICQDLIKICRIKFPFKRGKIQREKVIRQMKLTIRTSKLLVKDYCKTFFSFRFVSFLVLKFVDATYNLFFLLLFRGFGVASKHMCCFKFAENNSFILVCCCKIEVISYISVCYFQTSIQNVGANPSIDYCLTRRNHPILNGLTRFFY